MKELIHRLVSQADLTEEQAERVAQVVRDFLVEKLPDSIEGPVLAALSGKNVDGAADALRNAIGSIFGR
jgi:hypothetical protein